MPLLLTCIFIILKVCAKHNMLRVCISGGGVNAHVFKICDTIASEQSTIDNNREHTQASPCRHTKLSLADGNMSLLFT